MKRLWIDNFCYGHQRLEDKVQIPELTTTEKCEFRSKSWNLGKQFKGNCCSKLWDAGEVTERLQERSPS